MIFQSATVHSPDVSNEKVVIRCGTWKKESLLLCKDRRLQLQMTVLHYLYTLQASMWNLFVGFFIGLQLSVLIEGLVMEKLLEFLWQHNRILYTQ